MLHAIACIFIIYPSPYFSSVLTFSSVTSGACPDVYRDVKTKEVTYSSCNRRKWRIVYLIFILFVASISFCLSSPYSRFLRPDVIYRDQGRRRPNNGSDEV